MTPSLPLSEGLELLLRGGSLADKLQPLIVPDSSSGSSSSGSSSSGSSSSGTLVTSAGLDRIVSVPDFMPARTGPLAFSQERARFPKLTASSPASERAKALHFFANHELLAIELLAYAVAKYPDDPPGFHAGLLRTLAEEQTHLQMYLDRMAELGVAFGDFPLNGHFWQLLAPAATPVAFSCGMNLTFEQANLDFAAYYEQRFAAIGDETSAKIMARIAEDEVSHVSRGVYVVSKVMATDQKATAQEATAQKATAQKATAQEAVEEPQQQPKRKLWSFYLGQLPAAISPMRAKGTAFNRKLRRRAHLDDGFIEELSRYHESASQRSQLFVYNPDCEREVQNPHYSRPPALNGRIQETAYLMTLLASPGDGVVVGQEPSLTWRRHWADLGLPVAQPVVLAPDGQPNARSAAFLTRNYAAGEDAYRLQPWGQTRGASQLATRLNQRLGTRLALEAQGSNAAWFSKLELPRLRASLAAAPQGGCPFTGEVVHEQARLEELLASVPRSVIKAPFGAAGSGLFFIDDLSAPADRSAAQFVISRLKDKPSARLLWEPRCTVTGNFSAVGWLDEGGTVRLTELTEFMTSSAGQYAGHVIAPPGANPRLRAVAEPLEAAFHHAGAHLAALGYVGPFGIDAFSYTDDSGEPKLQPLSEVNSRFTMGHMAAVLSARAATEGLWQFVPVKTLRAAGYGDCAACAEDLLSRHPMTFEGSGKGRRWQEGIAILSDWPQVGHGLSILSVGAKPTKLLSDLMS